VNRSEQLIKDALHDIAAEAPAPQPMSDAAWQAGRRRRRSRVSAAASAGAGALAAAIALPLALAGSPGQSPSVLTGPTLPISLRTPIQFRQVATVRSGPCPAGSPGVPGPPANTKGTGTVCYRFTHNAMTVTVLQSATVTQGSGSYWLMIRFTKTDASRFTALTRRLAGQPSPRCQLAIVVGGRVMAAPVVAEPITAGQAEIPGFTSRAQAEHLLGR
jgi:SecDF, P1 head subdomain